MQSSRTTIRQKSDQGVSDTNSDGVYEFSQLLNLFVWLFCRGPKDMVDKISKVVLSGIVKLIGVASHESYDIQNAAYVALAQLAYVCPEIFNKDLQLVLACFEHLSAAPVELHNSIREALTAIAPAFRWEDSTEATTATAGQPGQNFVPNSNQKLLLLMLNDRAESELTIVQNVTCTFLTTCFPQVRASSPLAFSILGVPNYSAFP